MRNILIASAAAVALFTVAGAAQAQVVGHVGANYANTDADAGGFDFDADAIQLEGAAAFDVGGYGAQIDGSYTDSGEMKPIFSGTGHLNTQVGGARVGGFAGFVANDDENLWGVGAEAQADLAASTVLYGQAGYGKADEAELDMWAVRGEVRHYATEDLKLTASVGYVWGDQDVIGDIGAWNWGVEGEYKFENTPFSVFAGYDRFDSDDLNLQTDTVRMGVRYTFGGASLRARDAAGAALGGVTKLFGGVTN